MVHRVFKNIPNSAQAVFSNTPTNTTTQGTNSTTNTTTNSSSSNSPNVDISNVDISTPTPLAHATGGGGVIMRSIESFKVLTECPLIIMLLFQVYPKFIQRNIPQMLPLMMNVLGMSISQTGAQQNRSRFREFLAAQVSIPLVGGGLGGGMSMLTRLEYDAAQQSCTYSNTVCEYIPPSSLLFCPYIIFYCPRDVHIMI